jgi:hypothetical protein
MVKILQIKINYFLPIWWVISFWFEDANIIDQLAIFDLTGTDLIECMYGYTEMEALATYFDLGSESLLIQWQEFIQIVSFSDNRSLTHLNELFQSVDHKDKNLSSIYIHLSPNCTALLSYSLWALQKLRDFSLKLP